MNRKREKLAVKTKETRDDEKEKCGTLKERVHLQQTLATDCACLLDTRELGCLQCASNIIYSTVVKCCCHVSLSI
jgi:hypothetical protein